MVKFTKDEISNAYWVDVIEEGSRRWVVERTVVFQLSDDPQHYSFTMDFGLTETCEGEWEELSFTDTIECERVHKVTRTIQVERWETYNE